MQRKTFSVQKNCHLVKPMVICASDGYIVDVFGPYPAKDNDATILRDIMKTEKDLDGRYFRDVFHEGDLVLLDRGFRDVAVELRTQYKLVPKLPTCCPPTQKFLTTKEANESRFVTKCRWPIEADNGIYSQSFKAVKDISNKSLPHIMTDFRIASALINCFKQRWHSDVDNQIEIVRKMKAALQKPNHLVSEVEILKFKSKNFVKIHENCVADFPKIENLDEIRDNITLGSYQLKQCFGYLDEFLSSNGHHSLYINSEVFPTKSNNRLICAEIQSRHRNSTKYKIFVEYKPNINRIDAITGNQMSNIIRLFFFYCFINMKVGCVIVWLGEEQWVVVLT